MFTLPTALLTFTTIALAVSLREGRSLTVKPADQIRDRKRSDSLCRPLPVPGRMPPSACWCRTTRWRSPRNRSTQGDEAAAFTHYARYESWRLPGAGADLWYSRASLNLAQKTSNPVARFQALIQAGAAGSRATGTAEDPVNAWYSLAVLYAGQNDVANTEKCLRAAIAASPYWFKPHWTLAQVLRLQGRLPEAQVEAETAVKCDGGKDLEVSRTLAEIRTQQPLAK